MPLNVNAQNNNVNIIRLRSNTIAPSSSGVNDVKVNGTSVVTNKVANITVDNALNSSSANPIANNAVKEAVDNKVDKVEGKGLSSNDYSNEDKAKVQTAVQPSAISDMATKNWVGQQGFITNLVNDLQNYYLKSSTYNKNEVDTLINAIKQFTYEVVSVLPTPSASTMNKIYLVPSSSSQSQNVKDEYITLENSGVYSWEQIGSTSIDLSNYYTKSQTDDLLDAKQDVISDLSTIRQGASLGATALQSVPNTYRTSADQDLIDASKENTSNKVTSLSSSSTDTQYPSAKVTYDSLQNKVDKVDGKGLSQNDFTTILKDKLDGIEANAQVNVVNGALLGGIQATIDENGNIVIPIPTQNSGIPGIIKLSSGMSTNATNGILTCDTTTMYQYNARSVNQFISKGTLENVANARGWCTNIKTSMDSVATINTQYFLGEQTSVSFTLPTATAGQFVNVVFYSGTTPTTLSISGTTIGTIPTPQANQRIEISCLFDNNNWAILSNTMSTGS